MNIYVRHTAAALAARGWSVDLFTRDHAGSARCNHPTRGVRLFHVPAGPIDAHKDSLHEWVEPFVAGVLAIERATRTRGYAGNRRHGTSPYRAVLSHYWLSGLAGIDLAKHWRIRHVAGFHTLALAKEVFSRAVEPRVRTEGERRVVEQADHLLAVSHHEGAVLREMYGAAPDGISVASPGVDREKFRPRSRQRARKRLGLSPDSRILLAVGRMAPIKGFDVLLDALARIADQNVTLLFVGGGHGSGSDRDMQDLARRLEVERRVQFVGSVDHDLLPTYYAACDVCAIPSLYESFGLVALESIGCGRPVVASRVGGLPSIVVDDTRGVLVTPGSASELAGALERVLRETGTQPRTVPAPPELPSWSLTAGAISTALMQVTS